MDPQHHFDESMMNCGPCHVDIRNGAADEGTTLKTPMEVLEDLAREYEEQDKLKYEVTLMDKGHLNRPAEYSCTVVIGEVKGKAYGYTAQLAKMLAAQKVLDQIKQDGYITLAPWRRVEPGENNLDPVQLLNKYCRGYLLDAPSYQYWKWTLDDNRVIYSYRCFWRQKITEGQAPHRYVAQAVAAIKMMDFVIDSTKFELYTNECGDADDYISVKPVDIAKTLENLDKLDQTPKPFPVYIQKADGPRDPNLTCRYGIKSHNVSSVKKPQFVVEHSLEFTGHGNDFDEATANCIGVAKEYAFKLKQRLKDESR